MTSVVRMPWISRWDGTEFRLARAITLSINGLRAFALAAVVRILSCSTSWVHMVLLIKIIP